MRISSSTIYEANVAALSQQQSKMLHTQQQITSGRRILTPADDPIAAARALEVAQADATNTQYASNRNAALHSTAMAEGVLQSVTNLLQDVKTLAVYAGNSVLTASDKRSLATELSGRLDELLALSNSTDGVGNYLFSGFQGRMQPFTNGAMNVQYMADDGQRMIQVSSSRQLAASDSGADIFMRIKNGNGVFALQAGAGNTGSGLLSQGVVTNPALINGDTYQLSFSVAAGVTTYNITNTTTGTPYSIGNAYVSGQPINFQGMQLDIQGAPANGDVFTAAPSSNESLFKTLSNLISTLNQLNVLGGATAAAQFNNSVGQALNNLDRGLDNVLTVRASLGTRLRELESLQSTGEDLGLQYKQTLSQLQDVDFNKAISDLTQQQLGLQAAQKSFLKVSELSLFNYI